MAVLTSPMAASSFQDDPKHWRQRAQDARAAADRLDHPDDKEAMLEIAEGYEQLALLAEKKAVSKSNM
jgi:hypothetical protein